MNVIGVHLYLKGINNIEFRAHNGAFRYSYFIIIFYKDFLEHLLLTCDRFFQMNNIFQKTEFN
jgi:hypothetical protein